MSHEPRTTSRFKKVSAISYQLSALHSSGSFSLFCRNVERRTLNIEQSQKGFTALELIIVIMVLSVLAASVIIKNPFSIQDYSSMASDQLIADIRYVQIRAMGLGTSQSITFRVDASDYGLYDIQGERKKLPANIAVASTTFGNTLSFNSLGEPNIGTTNGSITLSAGNPITVTAITGNLQ